MKKSLNTTLFFLAISMLLASCASTTMIQSTPSDAKLYIDSQPVGKTPYQYTDTKIVGSMTMIRLEKEGYAPYITSFSRDEQLDAGALIGGLLITVPLLWTMKYNPVHSYELQPVDFQNQTVQSPVNASQKNYAADELTKLKDLLDRQAITKNDFSSLKEKILNERYDYSKDIPGRIAELKSLLDSELLTPEEYNSQKDKLVSGG